MFQDKAAPRGVSIGLNNLKTMLLSVVGDRTGLVFQRVLLVFSGHSEVLRYWDKRHGFPLPKYRPKGPSAELEENFSGIAVLHKKY
jgi:hypothetical protein